MSAGYAESASASSRADEHAFAFWTHEKIRFQDVDRFGHVNNVAFTVYAESGRIEFLEHVAAAAPLPQNTQWVIARLQVDFRAQAFYPGEMRIGTCVQRVGRSSMTLAQGLFTSARCVATAEAIVVLIDTGTGGSVALSPAMREALAATAA